MNARRYLGILSGTALLAAAIFALVGRWVSDGPAAIERRYVLERRTAEQIAQARPVYLASRLNEWMLRWNIARHLPKAPHAVVLGSSHGLGVTAAMLGDRTSMNLSISGCSLPDHLVTAGILEARGLHPRTWVIFVDAWLFDRGADFGAWQMSAPDLDWMENLLRQRARPPLEPTFATAFASTSRTTWRYSLDPVVDFVDGVWNELFQQVAMAHDGVKQSTVLGTDGVVRVFSDRPPLTREEVDTLALRQFGSSPDRHRYGTYGQIDEVLWKYFEQWVFHCQEQGEVWLILSPYHPAIYPGIVAVPQNQLRLIEARVRSLAQQNNLALLGSYDPVAAGVLADDFSDGDHLRESGLKKLLLPLGQTPAPVAPAPVR